MPKVTITKNGILCRINNKFVSLDPKRINMNTINFVSHAHKDHLPIISNNGTILASTETKRIMMHYGLNIKNFVDTLDNFTLIDNGHILGSKGLLLDDLFYTSDICTRNRCFIKGAKVPKCKIIITECTFGLPEFVFPKLEIIVKKVNVLISDLYSKGLPIILLGHALGKAQILTQLFSHWDPIYYHHMIKQINDLYIELGVNLKNGINEIDAEANGLLHKKPWIMITPFMSEKNEFITRMKSKFGAITIGFTGWANSTRFFFGRQHDYSFPLSDHCDFNELINVIHKTNAEKVYTTHGFVNEFSEYLKKIGIHSEPITEK